MSGTMLLLLIAVAVATVSMTVSKAYIFEWLRVRAAKVPWLGHMIICPLCLSYWVALPIVVWYRHQLGIGSLVDGALILLAVVGLAAPVSWVIFAAYGNQNAKP